MRGYHYTSWENWQTIKETGLLPYEIRNPQIRKILPPEDLSIKVVFTFKNWKRGEIAHYGQLLWAMMHRHNLHLVVLSYEYEKKDIYRWGSPEYEIITSYHDGELSTSYGEPWTFHRKEPMDLLLVPIPPEKITIEAEYNFKEFIDKADSL